MSTKNAPLVDLEAAMWKALDVGLERVAGRGKESFMIIIDGLDELRSFGSIKSVMQRLGELTSKHFRLQAITLSRDIPHKPSKGVFRSFALKPEHTQEDLRHVAEHAFRGFSLHSEKGEHEQEANIQRLIHAAQGSFLWLELTISLLRKETSQAAFEKALRAVHDEPQSLHQTIGSLTKTIDISRSDVSSLLSWMLVAERPLALAETKCLSQTDGQKKQSPDTRSDPHLLLLSLVTISHDVLRF